MKCPDCDDGWYSFPEASSVDMSDGYYQCERCGGTGFLPDEQFTEDIFGKIRMGPKITKVTK